MKALRFIIPVAVLAGLVLALLRAMSGVVTPVPRTTFEYQGHEFLVAVLPADVMVRMDDDEYTAGRLFDGQSSGSLDEIPPAEVVADALVPFHETLAAEVLRGAEEGFPSDGSVPLAGRLPTRASGPRAASSWCWEVSPDGAALIGCFGIYTQSGLAWSFDDGPEVVADARFVNDTTVLVVHALPGADGLGSARLVTTRGDVIWEADRTRGLAAGSGEGPFSAYVNATGVEYVALLDAEMPAEWGYADDHAVYLIPRAQPADVRTYRTGWPWPDSVVQAFMPPPPGVIRFNRRPGEWVGWLDPDGTDVTGGRAIVGLRWPEPPGDSVRAVELAAGEATYRVEVDASTAARDPILVERGAFATDLLVTDHRYAVQVTQDGAQVGRFTLERQRLARSGVLPWDGDRAVAPRPLAVLPGRGVVFQGRVVPTGDLVEGTPGEEWMFVVDMDGAVLASGQGRPGRCPDAPRASADGRYVLTCAQLFDLEAGTMAELTPAEGAAVAARLTGEGRLLLLADLGGRGRVAVADLSGAVLWEAPHWGFYTQGERWTTNLFPWEDDAWLVLDQYYCRAPEGIHLVRGGEVTTLPAPEPVESWPPSPGTLGAPAENLPELTVPMPCAEEDHRRFFVDESGGRSYYLTATAGGRP